MPSKPSKAKRPRKPTKAQKRAPTVKSLTYKLGRMGIVRTKPARAVDGITKMILDPCNAPLRAGSFGWQPTSINRFTRTFQISPNGSSATTPYTAGFVIYFPGHSTFNADRTDGARTTTGGSLFIWANSSSAATWTNTPGTNGQNQFGMASYDNPTAQSTPPKTAESIFTPDIAFMWPNAGDHQLVSSCIKAEFLGQALNAGGEIVPLNGVNPVELIKNNNLSVDDLCMLYGGHAAAIQAGVVYDNKFFSKSPNAHRRLTPGEGAIDIVRNSVTLGDAVTTVSQDGAVFTPLGYGFAFRNLPVSAVPGSATNLFSGVCNLRFKCIVIKEWNAKLSIGLSQTGHLPTQETKHEDAVARAAKILTDAGQSAFSAERMEAAATLTGKMVGTAVGHAVSGVASGFGSA